MMIDTNVLEKKKRTQSECREQRQLNAKLTKDIHKPQRNPPSPQWQRVRAISEIACKATKANKKRNHSVKR